METIREESRTTSLACSLSHMDSIGPLLAGFLDSSLTPSSNPHPRSAPTRTHLSIQLILAANSLEEPIRGVSLLEMSFA